MSYYSLFTTSAFNSIEIVSWWIVPKHFLHTAYTNLCSFLVIISTFRFDFNRSLYHTISPHIYTPSKTNVKSMHSTQLECIICWTVRIYNAMNQWHQRLNKLLANWSIYKLNGLKQGVACFKTMTRPKEALKSGLTQSTRSQLKNRIIRQSDM